MKQKGVTIWLTGYSGAGKSTIADRLTQELTNRRVELEVLDGDVVRTNLSKGLSFSREDRDINILRIGFVAELLTRHGVVVIVSAISPYRAVREAVREKIRHFVEVFVNAPLDVCEQRDVKGLYKKARAGEIKAFTGIDDPYEPPLKPEVICNTDKESLDESVNKILRTLEVLGYIPESANSLLAQGNDSLVKNHLKSMGIKF
ncbi:MAG: adenylyl-sulfate kinase [Bacteroidetes bacterium]|nr:adenylyl-sulfate kinase [Bacteroidota bacterium]